MTSLSLSLSVSATVFGRKFSHSFSYSASIPDEQKIVKCFEGSSLVISQADGKLSVGVHVPVFGQIWSKSVSEAGSHSISETYEGDTITGTLYVS